MPIARIHKPNNQCCYFITPTIKNWYYIFDRHNRWQILADSIIHFQTHKNLEVYSYVFMLNHLHLIVRSPDMIGFLRDFKKYTTKELIKNIRQHEPNVLELFKNEAVVYSFWKEDNQTKILETEKFGLQKLNYIHNNPVVKGYVERPEYWKWSSANPNSPIKVSEW
jgi:putative transposase